MSVQHDDTTRCARETMQTAKKKENENENTNID